MLKDHRVLRSVSRSYPRLAGSLITCYSPVRHATHPRVFTFDLHASSTPPTFVLSQDQTLHFMYVSSALSCDIAVLQHCSLETTCSSQGSIWLSVAKPQLTAGNPKTTNCRLRPATYPHATTTAETVASQLRIGLIKKLTRFFFRGHPECQRSSPARSLARGRGREKVASSCSPSTPAIAFSAQRV